MRTTSGGRRRPKSGHGLTTPASVPGSGAEGASITERGDRWWGSCGSSRSWRVASLCLALVLVARSQENEVEAARSLGTRERGVNLRVSGLEDFETRLTVPIAPVKPGVVQHPAPGDLHGGDNPCKGFASGGGGEG